MSNDETLVSGGNATIFVHDMNRAYSFYSETLGMKTLYRAGEHFAMLDAGGGFHIGLHPASSDAGPPGTNGSTQIGLDVAQSIEEVVKRLFAAGVEFVDQPDSVSPIRNDGGGIKLAFFRDPDGNVLYLCEQAM